MNKKILAMAIVPIFMMSIGAFAYSTYSGSLATNVTATSVPFEATLSASIGAYYAVNAEVTGSSASYMITGSTYTVLSQPHELGTSVMTTVGELTYSLQFTNLSAGDQVRIIFLVNNTGGGSIELSTPVVSGLNGFESGTFVHGNGIYEVTNATSFAYKEVQFQNVSTPNDLHLYDFTVWPLGYQIGESGVSDSPTLAPNGAAVFEYWFGLASDVGTSYSGQTASMTITVPVVQVL